MNEPQPDAVTPKDRARATRFAYVSLVFAFIGLSWIFIVNEYGEPNILLAVPCMAVSVLAIVFGAKSVRRTEGPPRAASIVGLAVGSIGAGLGGIYLLLMAPFLLWMLSGSS